MEENVKDKLILVLSILSIVFFVTTIGSCSNALRQKKGRDKEMGARLDLEEKITKVAQEKMDIENKIKAKDKEIEEAKAAQEKAEKALAQEQLVNQSLKEELQKVTRLKERSEEELKSDKSLKR